MNEAYKKIVLTIDASTDASQVFNLGNYTHFNYVSLVIDYDGLDKTDATVKFVQNDDGLPVWNEVPSLSAKLDDVSGIGSLELANAQFTASFVGLDFDKGTLTAGDIIITLIAKSW